MPEGSSLTPEQAPAPPVFRTVSARRLRKNRLVWAGAGLALLLALGVGLALRPASTPTPATPATPTTGPIKSALTVTTAPAGQKVMAENLLVVAVGDKAKIESGLRDLKLGPVESWSESQPAAPGGGQR